MASSRLLTNPEASGLAFRDFGFSIWFVFAKLCASIPLLRLYQTLAIILTNNE